MYKRFPLLLLLVVVLTTSCAVAQKPGLDRNEARIVEAIRSNYARNLELLRESVNINSGSLNMAGVRATGDHLAREFEKIGFQTEWIALPDSLKRAGHLVASRKGTKGKRVMLIGHLDTVFEPDMEENPFTYVNDSTVTGQGVADMKGGNIIILAACQALHQLGLLKDATVIAYFAGDEESTGKPYEVTRRDMIARAQDCDVALGFEGAEGLGKVAVGRRGIGSWRLAVQGDQGHSSQVFRGNGYGANYELVRILDAFRQRLDKVDYLTLNAGLIAGGTELSVGDQGNEMKVTGKTNIIAPRAVALGDLRYLTLSQRDSARKIMQEIVGQSLKGGRATIEFTDGFPSMPPTAGNYALVNELNSISMGLGYGPVSAGDPGSRGAGDISWVAQYVDAMDGLGAEGYGEHSPGEIMYLNSYQPLMERAAILLYRLTR